LADRNIELRTTPGAREWLASRGYDPVYGARPLKRLIQREVLDALAMKLLNGELHDGELVTIDSSPEGLKFQAALTEAPLVA
jgi:ATP-dependent Clp protease ATP-binding subunit ClpB